MIKGRHVVLHPTPDQVQILKATQQEAARCWNDIVTVAKAHYDTTHTWIGRGDLQKKLKGVYKLHSQTVQALVDKFCENRLSAAANRRKGNLKMKYPWRVKKFVTIPFKQMAIKKSETGNIVLTLSPRVRFDTGFVTPLPPDTCEVLWREGRYVLSWTAKYVEKQPSVSNNQPPSRVAGTDIGEIHPVAVCQQDGHGLVVSGREIRSIKQLRNKSLAWFSRALSKCKKGSRRSKKLVRAKKSLINKTDAQVHDLLHQATRKAIGYCVERGIAELVIGDLRGVEKNTKKEKRLNRKSRQKVSQMEAGTIKRFLKYKAKEAGISTCFVGERNTSKECPVCGKLNHPKDRAYRCTGCGFTGHRDGKAAFMMIRKKHPDMPTPEVFDIGHIQSIPKYRKRQAQKSRTMAACVDGPDVVLSKSVIGEPLCDG
jgi:putative transposase